jgi:uncharacterized protein DUF4169
MAEIVNLRRARKAKVRAASAAAADANRIDHGVSKGTRQRARAEKEKLRRETDSKKLDSGK